MTPSVRLVRIVEREDATLGVLFVDEIPRLVTLELPWRFNEKEISCIPIGRYKMRRVVSPKFGETFEVQKVPDRSGILFHAGNLAHNTTGCILVANRFGVTGGHSNIMESRDGFEWFLRHLSHVDNETDLTIQAIYPLGASAL